jgi:hypothetical protein
MKCLMRWASSWDSEDIISMSAATFRILRKRKARTRHAMLTGLDIFFLEEFWRFKTERTHNEDITWFWCHEFEHAVERNRYRDDSWRIFGRSTEPHIVGHHLLLSKCQIQWCRCKKEGIESEDDNYTPHLSYYR